MRTISTPSPIVWEKFKKTISKYSLVNPGDRVLLAVSGGPDSMCMLHLFHRLTKILHNLKLYVAYIDHGLRPKEVKSEIKLLRNTCSVLTIPVILKKIFMKKGTSNLESKARKLRYALLTQIAKDCDCNKIATGHNSNDNAETIILNLLRSTGQDGLKGIPIMRNITSKTEICLVRPLLKLNRNEIISYLSKNNISYCIDRTNLLTLFTRNYIRHKVIPMLEKLNPRIISHLNNLVEWNDVKETYFDNLVKKSVPRISKIRNKNTIRIDLLKFLRYNICLQYKLLRSIIVSSIRKQNFTKLVEEIIDFVYSNKNKLSLGQIQLKKTKNILFIYTK